jgi:hypothetical protein
MHITVRIATKKVESSSIVYGQHGSETNFVDRLEQNAVET